MDTAMLGGVGSGRGSSAPSSVLHRSRVVVDSGPTPEAKLAPPSSGVRTRRGTRRPPREPSPRRWTIPERAMAGLLPPAGLVPCTGVTLFASREWPGVRRCAQPVHLRDAQGMPPKGRTTVRAGGVERRPDLSALSPQALRVRWPGSATPSPVSD
jgi:hypothetical protein